MTFLKPLLFFLQPTPDAFGGNNNVDHQEAQRTSLESTAKVLLKQV